MFNVVIPKITDEELLKRYQKIKPIVIYNGEKYYLRDFSLKELRSTNYIYEINEETIGEKVNENELIELKGEDFSCIHSYGYYSLFKPSIAEVLAQINDLVLPFVVAFEIIKQPRTSADFYNDGISKIVFNNGFHISTVRLYGENK